MVIPQHLALTQPLDFPLFPYVYGFPHVFLFRAEERQACMKLWQADPYLQV